MDACFSNDCTDFHFSLKNNGAGCARTADLAGTVTLTKASGLTSTAKWTLTLGDRLVESFKPGDSRTARRDSGSLRDGPGAGTYTIAITTQSDIACP